MHNYRKDEKEIYVPKNKPVIVDIPKFKYFTISSEGNPNTQEFSDCISVLYKLSYFVRMSYKKQEIPEFYMYTVYPLEGIWDLKNRELIDGKINKNDLIYKIMIRQPEFVNKEVFEMALKSAEGTFSKSRLDMVKYEEIEEGLSVQMMHIGSFDNEKETFDIMKEFINENNLSIKSLAHKEIYLSDFRKTDPSKLKTVLRYNVEYK